MLEYAFEYNYLLALVANRQRLRCANRNATRVAEAPSRGLGERRNGLNGLAVEAFCTEGM